MRDGRLSVNEDVSLDWSAKVEPVPYAKIDDPQSFNLYTYVGNNPTTRVDSEGHWAGLTLSEWFKMCAGRACRARCGEMVLAEMLAPSVIRECTASVLRLLTEQDGGPTRT